MFLSLICNFFAMKYLNIIIGVFILLSVALSCSKDVAIGEVEPLEPDYVLPQGGSSVDDKIVELHDLYGSFILYDYSLLDFYYDLPTSYTYTLPDPQYVGDMLELLDDIWFQFYPAEFHEKYMPYKIFLVDELEKESWGKMVPDYLCIGEFSAAIGFCSDTLRKMSSRTKLEFKNTLQLNLWNSWYTMGYIDVPDAFFAVSDYTQIAEGYDTESPNYARKRGFIAKDGIVEWCTWINDWETGLLDKDMDVYTYLTGLVTRTTEEWESDLAYPLVKEKYDIIRNYFIENFNVDLQKIGDTVY